MNIKQLETLYWAVKLGSFTAAAERLNSTQSTVSMRIQNLEIDFGIELFDRSQRTARVTAKGRELVKYVEQLLNLMAEIRERLSAPETIPGTLRLGVVEMVSVTWLPALIRVLHESYPKIVLELDEALTQDLVAGLRSGALDLILAPGRMPEYDLNTRSLGTVEFVWMATPNLGVPDRRLKAQDLQQWPIVALSRESYHHSRIEDWFRSGNAYYRKIYTCKSLGVAASLASAGLGITLLPIDYFQDQVDSGRLKVIETDPPMTPTEFTATMAMDGIQPITKIIANLAQELSTFNKG
ncbi:MAG: LysR family transcriptional regulator [Proteobacteria bacterium]|nr:LysR family transcriptional regulator [Pseudomonadota bacterium]